MKLRPQAAAILILSLAGIALAVFYFRAPSSTPTKESVSEIDAPAPTSVQETTKSSPTPKPLLRNASLLQTREISGPGSKTNSGLTSKPPTIHEGSWLQCAPQ